MTDVNSEWILRKKIQQFCPRIESANEIYDLFRILGYPEQQLFDSSYRRGLEKFSLKKEEKEKITNVFTILSFEKNLSVVLVEATTIAHSFVKAVAQCLTEQYPRFLLIVTSDYREIVFLIPKVEQIETRKHKLQIAKLVVDKNDLYPTDLDTLQKLGFMDKGSWKDLWRRWHEAFSIEKITKRFFQDYQDVFFKVRRELVAQNLSINQAHECTLQLLNRMMFICFISKKQWLKADNSHGTRFPRWLWSCYNRERNKGTIPANSFYRDWLRVVFFNAFQKKFPRTVNLSGEVKEALFAAPYLNGGLFQKNEYDAIPITLNDELFDEIVSFYAKYRFTVREELFDVEMAVDPEMIGYVYESLANVAEVSYGPEKALRRVWGIFYTSRGEVEFMAKSALVEYFANHLPDVPKGTLYQFIFDEDKADVAAHFEKNKLWDTIETLLDDLSVVDPACGSGAFLVGMLIILAELYKFIYTHMQRPVSAFPLKSKIVIQSLYGVDIMPWAIHAAELRLWLQTVAEFDLEWDYSQAHPLLPDLSMNLRIGDSLVQELDGEKNHFTWENAFAEIFENKGGFDIVIGNPPYVEQTRISPPTLPHDEVTTTQKIDYKNKLAHSVQKYFPTLKKIDKRSDYYIYFYFRGLALLNPKGTLCFITSNSWLDVGFGAGLQEFLLKHVPLLKIYDGPKRAFAHADVNTIIALFGAPVTQRTLALPMLPSQNVHSPAKNVAKFVQFKKSFEEVGVSTILSQIERTDVKLRTSSLAALVENLVYHDAYRLFPVVQEDLLLEGSEGHKSARRRASETYTGSKWGSKFLRAPDIFFTILEKGKTKLVRLHEICRVEAGCYSGINAFFYLKPDQIRELALEPVFVVPLLKSPRNTPKIQITPSKTDTFLFYCQKSKEELRSAKALNALRYIQWGEKQVTKAKRKVKAGIPWPDVPTVRNRRPGWWAIKPIEPTRLFLLYGINDRFGQRLSAKPMISDRRFHMVYRKDPEIALETLAGILNSTLTFLFIELFGRVNLGQGALDFATRDATNLPILNPKELTASLDKVDTALELLSRRNIEPIFVECGLDPTKPIREQPPNPLPDRKRLDDLIFDAFKLTEKERKNVYWAVCELVKARLDKATSLKTQKGR